MYYFLRYFILLYGITCECHMSSLTVGVVETIERGSITFLCRVSSPMNTTRWAYISGSAGIAVMSYRNETCSVSPSDSFLNVYTRYSFTCNSTMYTVTLNNISRYDHHNILACRDLVHSGNTGATWILSVQKAGNAPIIKTMIVFNVMEVTEGDNVTLDCEVPHDTPFTAWKYYMTSGSSLINTIYTYQCHKNIYLDTASQTFFTCNQTTYQATRLDVRRSRHNDIYYCTYGLQGEGTNWILKVRVPVTSVEITPSDAQIDVEENKELEIVCQTSPARPTASVIWYEQNLHKTHRIEGNITSVTDYNDFSISKSTLKFVPSRRHHQSNIFCKAENVVNSDPVVSPKTQLNVLLSVSSVEITPSDAQIDVEENTELEFVCQTSPARPTASIIWYEQNLYKTHRIEGNITSVTDYNNFSISKSTLKFVPSREHHQSNIFCKAENVVNSDPVLSSKTQLNVLCLPRLDGHVESNIVVNRNEPIQLNITVVSNPLPVFTWWKRVGNDWQELQTTDEVTIHSDDVVSHLTIQAISISTEDVFIYKVVVGNSLGIMEQLYTVSINDTIDDSSTNSSNQFLHIIYTMIGGAVALLILFFIIGIIVGRKMKCKGCLTNDIVSNRRENDTNDEYLHPVYNACNREEGYIQPVQISNTYSTIRSSDIIPLQECPGKQSTYEDMALSVL